MSRCKTKIILTVFVCSFHLFWPACKAKNVIYEIKEEAKYAQEEQRTIVFDYVKPGMDNLLRGGWSKLRKEGSRLGAYPSSRLDFPSYEKNPLYFFCKCKPFERDQKAAKSLRILLNNHELAEVALQANMAKHIEIPFPPELVEIGDNQVELFYSISAGSEEKDAPEIKKQRNFSALFYELMVSSHQDYSFVKKFSESQHLLIPEASRSFFQKIPSSVDFYLDLPAHTVLEGRLTYLPLRSTDHPESMEIQVSLKMPGKREKIVYQDTCAKENNKKRFNIDFSPARGITRVRFQASASEEKSVLEGFLAWEGRFTGEKEDAQKGKKGDEDFLSWKQSLSHKSTIIVILDAARADRLSVYGHFRPTTPHLDKWAQESTVFTNAFSESLTTRCSIGTLFTGFPLTVNSLRRFTSRLPEELTTLAQMFQSKGFKTTGFAGVANVSSDFHFHRGFDQYFELYKEEDFFRKSQEYLPYVIPWLEANQDNTFYLYIHFKEPHAVYLPLPPFRGMFSDALEGKVDLTKHKLVDIAPDLEEAQIEYVRACYDENLASVDSVVGQIIKHMQSLGVLDRSILIVTSDHGELLGEYGRVFGHGGYFGEGAMHIPLIIRFPEDEQWKVPKKIGALVKTSDIFATLADIYQFEIPEDLITGRSLLPLLHSPGQEINPFVVVEKRGIRGYCYRSKKHKLIYWEGNAPIEYYDLKKDPRAVNNIYAKDDITAHFCLVELKKWIVRQKFIKKILLRGDSAKREIDFRQIDKKTIENLKALGYIK